jgi:hypothetical protein
MRVAADEFAGLADYFPAVIIKYSHVHAQQRALQFAPSYR